MRMSVVAKTNGGAIIQKYLSLISLYSKIAQTLYLPIAMLGDSGESLKVHAKIALLVLAPNVARKQGNKPSKM